MFKGFLGSMASRYIVPVSVVGASSIPSTTFVSNEISQSAVINRERPHPGIHAQMSCLAYAPPELLKQRMGDMSTAATPFPLASQPSALTPQQCAYADFLKANGWRVKDYIRAEDTAGKTNGYVGIAFEHPEHRHLVIAHRGTRPSFMGVVGDLYADIRLLRRQLVDHHISAMAFSLDMYQRSIDSPSPYSRIGFTGHSLGGVLAQLCLYAVTRFGQSQRRTHTYAVTFDNPGSLEFLERLEPTIHGSELVRLDELDITNYLSMAVNVINASGSHLGSVYAVYDPNFPSMSNNPIDYLKHSHDADRLSGCFDPITGSAKAGGYAFILMNSWPTISYPEVPVAHSVLDLVAKECLNNNKTYQQLSHKSADLMRQLVAVIPGASSIVAQASLLYQLGKTIQGISALSVDDTAYQAFREIQQATLQFGQHVQKMHIGSLSVHTATTDLDGVLVRSLKAQWEIAPLFDAHHVLNLRHFSVPVRAFLNNFYEQIIEGDLHHTPIFECLSADVKIPILLRYDIKKAYVNTKEDVLEFREQIERLAHTWKEEKYFKKFYWLTSLLNTIGLSQGIDNAFNLAGAQTILNGCRHYHWLVLRDLRALQTQSRLYLNGIAPLQEIVEHEQRHQDLSELQDTLRQQKSIVAQRQDTIPPVAMALLLSQFDYQENLLDLAQKLNLALLHLKQKQPQKVLDAVDGVLQAFNEPDLQAALQSDAMGSFMINPLELYACCYNLRGKAKRQQWQPTNDVTAPESQEIIMAYQAVLKYIPDDSSTLSSLAAFYDDLADYDTAHGYHQRALMSIGATISHVIDKERKAVTYSNYARNQYRRAQHSNDIAAKTQLLNDAQARLEASLQILPNAGTYLDYAEVFFIRADLTIDAKVREQYKSSALSQLTQGLSLEPDNAKLLVHRSELHLMQGNINNAGQDAGRARLLLEDKQALAGYEGYLARTQRVLDGVTLQAQTVNENQKHSSEASEETTYCKPRRWCSLQ